MSSSTPHRKKRARSPFEAPVDDDSGSLEAVSVMSASTSGSSYTYDVPEGAADNIDIDSSTSPGTRTAHATITAPVARALLGPVQVSRLAEEGAPMHWQMSRQDCADFVMDYGIWYDRASGFNRKGICERDKRTKKHTLSPEVLADRQRELMYIVDDLYHIWLHGCSSDREGVPGEVDAQAIAHVMFFGPDYDKQMEPNEKVLSERMKVLQLPIFELFDLHEAYELADSDNEEHNRSLSKLNSVYTALNNAYRMLLHSHALKISLNPTTATQFAADKILFLVENYKQSAGRMEDSKPLTKLVLHVIAIAEHFGYRRYRDGVYREVIVNGYRTNYWERVCDMKHFINEHCSRQSNFEMFDMLISGRHLANVESVLREFDDAGFPFVRVDRHVFSFRNGVYFAAQRLFRPYTEGTINWCEDSKIESRGRINRKRSNGPSYTNASANYFDCDFDDSFATWDEIPTPTVDKLLNDQEIPAEAQKIIWALIGRLLYDVGEMDDWQIILYLLGRANTGKSTLCKLVQIFYRVEDVAVLSNNIEEQFGLQAIYDKLAFVGPEIKKDFRLPQALFQSMVSGEGMSVSIKFKEAVSVDWKVPGLIAGNDVPSWVDNSNSVVRRLAMVHFLKRIVKVDGEIGRRLEQEVATILLRANQAYHMLLDEYGHSGIWEKLPRYFLETQNKLKAKTHPVYHFLDFGDVEFVDQSLYTSMKVLQEAFMVHCVKVNCKRPMWTEELYSVAFQDRNLVVETADEIEFPIGSGIMERNIVIVRGIMMKEHSQTLNQQLPELFAASNERTTAQEKSAAPGPALQTHRAIPAFNV